MSQWGFVAAAYAITIIATVGLIAWSYRSMRAAEAEAETLKRRQ